MRFGTMRPRMVRAMLLVAAMVSLSGCGTSGGLFNLSSSSGQDAQASATAEEAKLPGQADEKSGLLGSDANDDLSLGKKHYRAGQFGLAEQHFRRAVESHPRDGEAWLGLAASYDRLRRFDLADRAYTQAINISGPTVEILNNQGYSYMLRGDYKRARVKLAAAQNKAPDNPYVKNNLRLLAESSRQGKAIR